jgi:ABC-type multidrug transport system ATPase subunit
MCGGGGYWRLWLAGVLSTRMQIHPWSTQFQSFPRMLARQISALLDALDAYEGAVVVISHDRPFCEAVRCSHVAYVSSGRITLEERSLRDADFTVADRGVANVAPGKVLAVEDRQAAAMDKAQAKVVTKVDRVQQKARGNAPQKIKTIEKKVRHIGSAEPAAPVPGRRATLEAP